MFTRMENGAEVEIAISEKPINGAIEEIEGGYRIVDGAEEEVRSAMTPVFFVYQDFLFADGVAVSVIGSDVSHDYDSNGNLVVNVVSGTLRITGLSMLSEYEDYQLVIEGEFSSSSLVHLNYLDENNELQSMWICNNEEGSKFSVTLPAIYSSSSPSIDITGSAETTVIISKIYVAE